MKKITLAAMVLLCSVAFTNCAAKKPIKKQAEPQPPIVQQTEEDELDRKIREMEKKNRLAELEHKAKIEQAKRDKELAAIANEVSTYNVPCVEDSYDDDDYFRDYGIGNVEGGNEQLARERASQAAKDMIKKRLGEYIQGMTDYFLESYSSNKSDKDAAGNRARTKLNGVVEGMLRNADKVCERTGVDAKGNTKVYYTIQIPKKELNKKLMDVMSEDDKLRRDFNAEQMQKFMDERMQQMLEAKRAAGY